MIDPYCYKGTDVLKNKFGIEDQNVLEQVEVNITCNAIHELSRSILEGNYDFEHFCKLHSYIFKDIYEWAGKPRVVEMEKAEAMLGYMSIEYAKPKEIMEDASTVLKRMNSREWNKMSLDEQAKNLTNDLADLWKVHCFREGNTRTTVTFVCQFADSKGMFMDRELFEKNSSYTRNALVAANAIFKDGNDFRKTSYLYNIIKDSLDRGQKNKEQEKKTSLDDWKRQISEMKEQSNSSKNSSIQKHSDRSERV